MCLANTTCKQDKIYVHTSKYDVVIHKAKFLNLLRKSYPNIVEMLNEKEINAIYAIFCYDTSIIKIDFSIMESKFDIKPYSMELVLKSFEDALNEVLNKMIK